MRVLLRKPRNLLGCLWIYLERSYPLPLLVLFLFLEGIDTLLIPYQCHVFLNSERLAYVPYSRLKVSRIGTE